MGPQRYCDHTFICIKGLNDFTHNGNGGGYTLQIAIIGCVYCGQIRHMEPNGNVTTVVEEGKVIKKRNDQSNPDQKI